jgi:hypothetical protein
VGWKFLAVAGTAKKGATAAPFFGGRGSLPLLAALFLPALGRLFCHYAYPPLHSWDSDRESFLRRRSAAACLARRPASDGAIASLLTPAGREVCSKKLGVSAFDTPSRQAERLALLPALFLSALSSLLRHDSSLELAAQLF